MAQNTAGDNVKLSENRVFRSISPNEYVKMGDLVWIETTDQITFDSKVEGPYFIADGWGPEWFGSPHQNSKKCGFVLLQSAEARYDHYVTHGSFLNNTYYVMNEEKLCTDAETK
jgi:hypothetical protein